MLCIPVIPTNYEMILALGMEIPQPIINDHGGVDRQFLIMEDGKEWRFGSAAEAHIHEARSTTRKVWVA